MTEILNGEEYSHFPGESYAYVHDRTCEKYSLSYPHHHYTIGIYLQTPPTPMSDEEVAAWTPKDGEAIIATRVEDAKIAKELAQLIKRGVRYYETADASRYLRVRQTLSEIIAIMTEYAVDTARTRQRKSYAQENKYCRRACSYIAENFSKKISVEDVAKHAGISYGYLSCLFQQAMGCTVVEYINQTRIHQAAQLISVYQMPLDEVCAAVGINDTKYLSTLFKSHMGMTIRDYKKMSK